MKIVKFILLVINFWSFLSNTVHVSVAKPQPLTVHIIDIGW